VAKGSRPAEAVETGGMIRPLKVVEIDGACADRVGFQRRPNGVREIRTGVHHDDQTAVSDDLEPKLISPQATDPHVTNSKMASKGLSSATRIDSLRNRIQVVPSIKVKSKVEMEDSISKWRAEPATEKQKDKLLFFGCTWDEGITKGQAHDAIDSCVKMFPEKEKEYQNRPATEAQIEEIQVYLEAYGETLEEYVESGQTLTYQQANQMIKDWQQDEEATRQLEEMEAIEKEYIIDVGDWAEIYPGLTWKRAQTAAENLDKTNPGWRQDQNHVHLMLEKVAELNPQLAERWGEKLVKVSKLKPIKTKQTKAKPIKTGWYTQHCLHCGGAIKLQLSGIPADRNFTEEDMTLVPITCPRCGCTTEVLSLPSE
jgi:hypothetical protein